MFEKLNSFTKKVADLPDQPTLDAAALKAQFDAAADEVRQYLNKLIDATQKTEDGDSGADNIKMTTISGLSGNSVQAVVESLKASVDAKVVASGESMSVIEASFSIFTGGTTNGLNLTVTLPKVYATPPVVVPCNITQTVDYAERMNFPLIQGTTTSSFNVILALSNQSQYFGQGTLKMKFLVFGK
jgi:hypothetical protein